MIDSAWVNPKFERRHRDDQLGTARGSGFVGPGAHLREGLVVHAVAALGPVGEAHERAGRGRAHAARGAVERAHDGGARRGLREPVARDDVAAQADAHLQVRVGRQRRAAADHQPHAPAQQRAHLREHLTHKRSSARAALTLALAMPHESVDGTCRKSSAPTRGTNRLKRQ